ncbi:Nudix hydrolase 24, chloroplastic [Orchesella cincta]|uniref:Nudix hydrolase 24, chloroplastic n=1 Tax=Orchesella cincta TaxID=48709 RepID=A0A1D2MSF2_ORCCI|nr:Nudix hydrolase 24, chloroplastic [Orchesella cincta]
MLPDLIMDRARKMNCFFLNRHRLDSCKPLIIEDFQVGLITPEVMRQLQEFPDVFVCSEASVQLHPSLNDYKTRSTAVEQVLNQLRKNDVFITLRGWRDECYEVRADISEPSLMRMERAATCLFGIRQFGVDINGYVNHPELGLSLWMQRRSQSKPRWGGKLDNVVGGGLSVGFTVEETAHKEAMEEAGIPEYILKNLQPVGNVMIFFESERGLSPNTEFVYDLEFPVDFVPENQDGEVESFHLVPIKDVLPIVLSDEFKTTSLPVVLDFLVRHGVIDTESDPELGLLSELLHIPLGYFYRRATLGAGPGVPPPPLLPPPLVACMQPAADAEPEDK